MPKVSVIIPTYNRKRFLIKAIESILQQQYKDYQIIVVDDASTDGTETEIAKRFADLLGKKLIFIRNRFNQERIYSRNLGIKIASGEYVAFLDADDLWKSNHLSLIVKYLEDKPNVALVFTPPTAIDEQGKQTSPPIKKISRKHKDILEAFLVAKCSSTSGIIIRKSAFDEVGGFNEALSLNPLRDDWELSVRLACHFQVTCLPTSTYYFRRHAGNSNVDQHKWAKCTIRTANEILSYLEKQGLVDKKRKALLYRYLGEVLVSCRELGLARHYIRKSLLLNPKQVIGARSLSLILKCAMPVAVLEFLAGVRRGFRRLLWKD